MSKTPLRRPLDAADPARHVLLGLLLDGPRHGYDLARSFAPGTVLGSVVHLGSSHLYALLSRLERDGLVRGEVEDQRARPPRHVYHITEAGRAEVVRWVAEPVARPRDVLLDFPLKLYLARHLNPQDAADLVARQRALFEPYLDGLMREQEVGDHVSSPPEDHAFIELLRQGRIARTEATLAWLDRCAALLAEETSVSRP
ncbi:MAG TPA: PadR family transcriptional regulator [Chloroflexota bacterium]|nr:PadR family transcriptional regulator [Chloroflexota bacterium]